MNFDILQFLFGGDKPIASLTTGQFIARAMVVYVFGMIIVRCGKRRLLGRATPIDLILGVMLGALLSGAIIGTVPLSGAGTATTTLVAMHSFSTWLACRSHAIGNLIKGKPVLMVRDGIMQEVAMGASHMSEHDLREEMHISANLDDLSDVESAYLERSGEISIVKKKRAPEVEVKGGVQIIRIING